MDVFLITPLFNEFRKKVDGEMNLFTKVLFYLIPVVFGLTMTGALTLDKELYRVTILAFSIFLGFSLNLFILIVNSSPDPENGSYEDVKETLQTLRVITLFEVFVALLVVVVSLMSFYFNKSLSSEILCGFTWDKLCTFLTFYLIGLFILIMLKIIRDSAIIVSGEYLGS